MRKLTILFALLTLSVRLWAQENAEQNTLPTRTITWLVNNSSVKSESKEEGVKLNTLTMPSTPENDDLPCADRFIGWSRENLGPALGQEAPTDLFTDITKLSDSEVVGSTDITFYAVFATSGGASASSSITSFATGDYLLIDTYNGHYYAMSGSGSTVSSADITSAVNKSADGTISVDVSESVIKDAMFYTIGGSASAATIYNIEDGKYVQGGSNTSFTIDDATNTWEVTKGDGRFTFVYDNRCILYRDGYNFRNYGMSCRGTSGYGTGYLYLVPTMGYEDYVTSCGKSLSISPKSLTAERSNYGTGTLIATANLYTPTDYTWSSDNESVATVSSSGATVTVTYHASGLCTITCSAPDGSNPMTATATVTVPASSPTPISTMYIDENGVEQTTDALEVTSSDKRVSWGARNETTWYVVTGEDVTISKGVLCDGDVRLILADNAILTVRGENTNQTPGIYVTGDNSSLVIYGQTNQSGQLIATGATGAAGIGGASGGKGKDITINGGIITAIGGEKAAGIGGGGSHGNGLNIVINGGTVTASGGQNAASIGGGEGGSASNIFISDAYVLYAGTSETLTDADILAHSSATDLSSTLTQRYVKIEGLAAPYMRSVTDGQWGTVCLPYAATSFSGATFYKVNYYDASDPADLKLYIEEITALEAGMPYIFEATATGTLTINHEATTPMAYYEVQTEGYGLYGSLARKVITSDGNMAAISGGKVVVAAEGKTVTVPACRAYLDMNEVPRAEQPHSAPLRVMGAPRGQATDLESVHDGASEHSDKCTMHDGKYIINGQLVIVKYGKTYNAQGTLIKNL